MSGTCPGVVTFDYSQWQFNVPTLAAIPEGAASGYFDLATIYCDNTPISRIRNLHIRARILGLLTAHIATLMGPGASGLVGRITNASEGSVNVAVDMPGASASAAWFNQTTFGAAAYQAMAAFRQGGRYTPGMAPYAAGRFGVRGGF